MRHLIVTLLLVLMWALPASAATDAGGDAQSVGGSNVTVIKDKARDDACSGGLAATGLAPAFAFVLLTSLRRRREAD